MVETLCFLLSERKGKKYNYVGIATKVHVNIFVRSQTAINLFENTCEDILNLSKDVKWLGIKIIIYQPYSSTFVSQSVTSDIIHFSSFKAHFLKN